MTGVPNQESNDTQMAFGCRCLGQEVTKIKAGNFCVYKLTADLTIIPRNTCFVIEKREF